MSTRAVLNLVIIAHEPSQIHVLLRCLNDLSEQFLEATMVSQYDKLMTKQILMPFFDGCDNREQVSHVR